MKIYKKNLQVHQETKLCTFFGDIRRYVYDFKDMYIPIWIYYEEKMQRTVAIFF